MRLPKAWRFFWLRTCHVAMHLHMRCNLMGIEAQYTHVQPSAAHLRKASPLRYGEPTWRGLAPPTGSASQAPPAEASKAAAAGAEAASVPSSAHACAAASPEESAQREISASAARLSSAVAPGAPECTAAKPARRELRRRLVGVAGGEISSDFLTTGLPPSLRMPSFITLIMLHLPCATCTVQVLRKRCAIIEERSMLKKYICRPGGQCALCLSKMQCT